MQKNGDTRFATESQKDRTSFNGAPIDERESNVQARVADGDLCLEQTGWMRGMGG
ncbi:MAG: hypothetical protein SPK06_07560 [Kiritimatiellia bacterium]|nr:hypothetical protein [Kiritimatiellia bacterium]